MYKVIVSGILQMNLRKIGVITRKIRTLYPLQQ